MIAKLPGRIGITPLPGAGTFAGTATRAVFIGDTVGSEVAARMRVLGETLAQALGHVGMTDRHDHGGSGRVVAVAHPRRAAVQLRGHAARQPARGRGTGGCHLARGMTRLGGPLKNVVRAGVSPCSAAPGAVHFRFFSERGRNVTLYSVETSLLGVFQRPVGAQGHSAPVRGVQVRGAGVKLAAPKLVGRDARLCRVRRRGAGVRAPTRRLRRGSPRSVCGRGPVDPRADPRAGRAPRRRRRRSA